MRGAGKTTLGKRAAQFLNWQFLDMDELIVKHSGLSSCKEIVEQYGWGEFRNLEYQMLEQTLLKNPTNSVISCGGGVVENENSRRKLQEWFPVINVERDFADIELVLGKGQPVPKKQKNR